MPDLGDTATATLTVNPFDGTTAATLHVTAPDGTETDPATTTADGGATWTATIVYEQAGWWLLEWTVTGTGAGVEPQRVWVQEVLGTPPQPVIYASVQKLRRYLMGQEIAETDRVDDEELADALRSVSREIDRECSRVFSRQTAATVRVFRPLGTRVAYVHDFHTTTGLIVATDDDDDGTYETTWDSSDFELEPADGIMDGETGWPFSVIRAVDDRTFPTRTRRKSLQVTAQWGWAAVPDPVRQACLILAAETHKLRQAPFGVAGFGEFGVVRVRDNPMAARKLAPYMLEPVLVA